MTPADTAACATPTDCVSAGALVHDVIDAQPVDVPGWSQGDCSSDDAEHASHGSALVRPASLAADMAECGTDEGSVVPP